MMGSAGGKTMYRRSHLTVVQIVVLCLFLASVQYCRDHEQEMADKDFEAALKEDTSAANALTSEERAEGWELLFDGTSLDHWRGFKQQGIPIGWVIRGGAIHFSGGEQGGDIISREQYQDFELKVEWRVSEGGNSGIFFHVSEDFDRAWESGPEMQVLDNDRHRDGSKPETRAGTNYALHPASQEVVKPAGEWNQFGLIVNGAHVEHWVNGKEIVGYELWSEDWKERVAKSKFAAMPAYGQSKTGHIALQDHGDPVWFRAIKIRRLNSE